MAATKNVTGNDIIRLIVHSVRERGYPPTVRELMAQTGLKSPASVQHHLKVLEEEGRIRRVFGSPRAIQLMEDE